MPMATIREVGDGLYHIHFLDQRTDPGYGRPEGGRPGHDLPGSGARPDHSLPGSGARPDQGLPSYGRPDNTLPGGRPGIPNHDLPQHPPPNVAAGQTLILVRTQDGKWHYSALNPGTPPPKPLPTPPPEAQPKG